MWPQERELNAFFEGEVEPCINGQVATVGAYFGQDIQSLIARLLAEQLADGGWNWEAASGSTRSSFNTTICVLEACSHMNAPAGAARRLSKPATEGKSTFSGAASSDAGRPAR